MSSTTLPRKFRSSKYRSLGLVGQGQFGQVYCAIHRKTGRLVALKHLNRKRFATHQFLRELRFLLSLDHPHIANCLSLNQASNGRQLVLEYCEGGTLRDLLEQETQLTLAEILTLIIAVLEALEHAHRKHIVHCDIKPENILLTLEPDGWRPKVSDFGIARLSEELRSGHTGATGSPAYMAPERFYYQVSAASDLYAIGVVLYELLVGARPFAGSYNQLMVSHLNHEVKLPAAVPLAIQEILKKATEKLIPRRFQNATEMKASILAARRSFTAAELRDRFPTSPLPTSSSAYVPRRPISLSRACTALSLSPQGAPTAYLTGAFHQDVYRWPLSPTAELERLTPQQHWHLEHKVAQILHTVAGAVAVTAYAVYQLQETASVQLLMAFDEPIAVLPGSDRWLIVRSAVSGADYWLVDVLSKVPVEPYWFTLLAPSEPTYALALNERYFLIAAVNGHETDLQFITRWGQSLGHLHLQAPIHQLATSQIPNCFLAQAGTEKTDLLIVHLRPYRVIRCRLDIMFEWLGELVTGFVAISTTGQMRLVNFQGQVIGQVTNLPIPRAIAFQAPYHIWLTSEQSGKPQLHRLDIRELNLDIVF
ncbi:MAG: serine/threonine-protein kinase [Leptolyngbyaceae cyanobacterium]